MATNSNNLQISNLDFDSIKNNFKEYLKAQDTFKDYNFDASSLNILLDIFSYNTFYNSFYANMIGSEMFLDTATQRESVVSRSKALGYNHSSATCASVYVDIESRIDVKTGETAPPTITITKYSTFLTQVEEKEFTFTNTDNIILTHEASEDTASYWVYKAFNVKIHEGKAYSFSWLVGTEFDKYIIPNSGVDVSTLAVRVYEDKNSLTYTTYSMAQNILNIDETSTVFWSYEDIDEKFYLEFGNDVLGKKVSIGNVINATYLVTNGASANGAKSFSAGTITYDDSTLNTNGIDITNTNNVILYVSDISGDFTANSLIRSETSNTTGYISSFDSSNLILHVKYTEGGFVPLEKIHEEYVFANNAVVFGANCTIKSITNEISISSGGSNIESIDNIKFNAPKFYSSQNRMVTSSDYEVIIKNEYPFIESVIAWGSDEDGEAAGTVYVSIKPYARETLDTWEKTYVLEDIIAPKKMIGLNVELTDPDYVYIKPTINVKYSSDASSLTYGGSIKTAVESAIKNACSTILNKFKSRFYYTNFCSVIDDSIEFILGNESTIELYKKFEPVTNIPYTANNTAVLNYSNELKNYNISSLNNIYSSLFTCNSANTIYTNCHFMVNEISTDILSVANNTSTIITNAGDIDYINGLIRINNVNIVDTEFLDENNNPYINIYVEPESNDLVSGRNQILKMSDDLGVTTTPISTKI